MTISEATRQKNSSRRHVLVRLEPARYIVSDLASAGGGVYTMTFPFPVVSKIERNGAELTLNAGLGSNDQWYHDETTGLLSVKLAAAPSSTNVIVAYYYLFYSSGSADAYQTPTDSATASRHWEQRITASPRVTEGFRNITSGIFTFERTDFSIQNVDHAFESYLGSNDSFYQKSVDVWLVVDSEISKIYTGKISAINLSERTVGFAVFDTFAGLNQPLLMGDSADEAYYLRTADSFPDMDPNKIGEPIPYIFGASSPNSVEGNTSAYGNLAGQVSSPAVCIDYEPLTYPTDDGDDENRIWGLCRVSSAGLKTLDFGTVSNVTATGGFSEGGRFDTDGDDNLELGDCFTYETSLGALHYVQITRIQEDTPSAGKRRVTVLNNLRPQHAQGTLGFASSGTFHENDAPHIWIDGRRMLPDIDFSWSTDTTSAGNKFVKVTFEDEPFTTITKSGVGVWTNIAGNVYEAIFLGPGPTDFVDIEDVYRLGVAMTRTNHLAANDEWSYEHSTRRIRVMTAAPPADMTIKVRWHRINPAQSRVTYVVRTADTGLNHADAIQTILGHAGISSIDSATFAAAEAALAANVRFMIPYRDSKVFESARHYLEDILASTLGFLRINDAGSVEYELLSVPAAGATRDDSLVLVGSATARIEYEDVATRLVASNIHVSGTNSGDGAASAFDSSESLKARYLHGVVREVTFTHVLDDISDRIDLIMALRANRRAVYKWSTATEDIETRPGDDQTLTSDIALGGSGSTNLKVSRAIKSQERVEIEATDLLGL